VHLLDIVQFAFDEAMPQAVTAHGAKFYVTDNLETPDTMLATFHYPMFIGCYESRTCNPLTMYGEGYGTSFHGTDGTLVVNRGGYKLYKGKEETPSEEVHDKSMSEMNVPHWKNFLECIRTRQKPQSDIETCVRSTVSCLLANLSMRHNIWLDWDEKSFTVKQPEMKQYLQENYRAPWKLEV
jgi:predicted dehydrogenase